MSQATDTRDVVRIGTAVEESGSPQLQNRSIERPALERVLQHLAEAAGVLTLMRRPEGSSPVSGPLPLEPEVNEISRFPLRAYVHPEDLDQVHANLHQRFTNAVNFQTNYRVIHDDKFVQHLHVHASTISDRNSDWEHVDELSIEIVSSPTAKSLLTSEHRFRSLFEYVSSGVVIVHADGHVVACNPAGTTILSRAGIDTASVSMYSLPWQAIPAEESPEPIPTQPLRSVLANRRPLLGASLEIPAGTANERRFLVINLFPWRIEGTDPGKGSSPTDGILCTIQDITDQRKAEDSLATSREETRSVRERFELDQVERRYDGSSSSQSPRIIGQSDSLQRVLKKVEQVAPSDSPVLVTGETGTGKELIAQAVHAMSGRKDRPLVKVNCAAMAVNMIESELFGHERGAFTGATDRRTGRFELAVCVRLSFQLPTSLAAHRRIVRFVQLKSQAVQFAVSRPRREA